MQFDFLIVGAGLYGAVFASEALKANKRVLLIEKRGHVGGNAHTHLLEGICTHVYGAHIFHTNSHAIWTYIQQFGEFNNFINSPLANYKGEIYNLPFNMNTFSRMWNVISPEAALSILDEQRKEITGEPTNLEEQAISLVGRDVYEKLIRGYTQKQWGRPCDQLPAFIIKRLPVRMTYDNNYFSARYQGIPVDGYTALVERMLTGVPVRLGVDYLKDKRRYDALAERVVYTGPIDAYFGYALGPLEYRSVSFDTRILNQPNFQGVAVVNYTDADTPYTRIIEHKHFAFGEQEKTVISYEYSQPWQPGREPYYPVNDDKNGALYLKYKALADTQRHVVFGGRLGEYRYYDMDQVIASALEKAAEVLS